MESTERNRAADMAARISKTHTGYKKSPKNMFDSDRGRAAALASAANYRAKHGEPQRAVIRITQEAHDIAMNTWTGMSRDEQAARIEAISKAIIDAANLVRYERLKKSI